MNLKITVVRHTFAEIAEAIRYLTEEGYILEDSPRHYGNRYQAIFRSVK